MKWLLSYPPLSEFQIFRKNILHFMKKKKKKIQKEHFTPPDYFRPQHATDSKCFFFFFFSIPLSKEVVLHLPTTTGLSMPLIINVFFPPVYPWLQAKSVSLIWNSNYSWMSHLKPPSELGFNALPVIISKVMLSLIPEL